MSCTVAVGLHHAQNCTIFGATVIGALCSCYGTILLCDHIFIVTEVPVFSPDGTIISPRESMYLCLTSLISLRESLRLFPTAPSLFTESPHIYACKHLHDRVESFDDIVIEAPYLFLTAHSGKMLIFSSRKQSKVAINQWFSPLIAVVCPSEIPSVLSGINRIFTVASMIFRSSIRLGCAMYIRSICNLS